MTFFDIHRGKLRRTYVHANDVSWTPGTYAFSEQRSGGGLTRRSFLTDEWGLELEDEEDFPISLSAIGSCTSGQ